MLWKTFQILHAWKIKLWKAEWVVKLSSHCLWRFNSNIYRQMENTGHWNIHYSSNLITEFDFPHVPEKDQLF